jgi:hypothetical protein
MSEPHAASPAKLLIGIFSAEMELIVHVARELSDRLGAVEMISPWFDFDYTEYYYAEMGRPLRRRVFVFRDHIQQDQLPAIKHLTNGVENRYQLEGRRRVNIDPGYLLKERLVLATGKNFAHRIYIGQCIFADLTLIYQDGAYRPLPWTYPDYADPAMRSFLDQARERFDADFKSAVANPTFE